MIPPDISPQPEELPALEVLSPDSSSPARKALSIWRLPDFVKFWAGQSVSKLGDSFALLALPLLLLQLTGDPLTLGFAGAAYYVPYLVLGLPAGALVDRLPRRRVMMVCDATHIVIFSLMVALLVPGFLRRDTVWVIFVLQAINGMATVFFDVSYLAATPNLVAPDQLLAANSALQVSDSTSQFAGPPLAGAIFQAFGAALSLVADAVSFVVSFISLALIPHEFRSAGTQENEVGATKPHIGRDIREGLRFVWGQPVLRWTTALIAVSNFFSNAVYPLILFHMRNQLQYSGGVIGIIYGCQAIGGIAGSVVAGRLGRRFGMLPIVTGVEFLISLYPLVFLATGQTWIFALTLLIRGMGNVVINVNILTVRQAITPDQMLSRMQGGARVIAWALIPAGTLAGPALAIPLGLPAVLILGSLIPAAMTIALFLSPIRWIGNTA